MCQLSRRFPLHISGMFASLLMSVDCRDHWHESGPHELGQFWPWIGKELGNYLLITCLFCFSSCFSCDVKTVLSVAWQLYNAHSVHFWSNSARIVIAHFLPYSRVPANRARCILCLIALSLNLSLASHEF